MRSGVLAIVLVLALIAASVWWFKLEPGPPEVAFAPGADLFGRTAAGDVTVTAAGAWLSARAIGGAPRQNPTAMAPITAARCTFLSAP